MSQNDSPNPESWFAVRSTARLKRRVTFVVVSVLVVVAWSALLMHVQLTEANCWVASHCPVVSGVVLPIVIATAGDARLIKVSGADVGVESGLGFFHPVGSGLERLQL